VSDGFTQRFAGRDPVQAVAAAAAAPAPKVKHPRAAALEVARELVAALREHCVSERIIVAGSLRRRKAEVGDVEIVFVPRSKDLPKMDFFSKPLTVQATDAPIQTLLSNGVLAPRLNVTGHATWGTKNKLATHVKSGIAVDLFSIPEECFFNYLVCRTGGRVNNTKIAMAAQAMNPKWKWNPYGTGFSPVLEDGDTPDASREAFVVTSERAVFDFVGMEYREPWERE
jgi:DNA polymerase/3'-5' exonuclease PolX